jgi:L-alanine-DL-glutamate epimerase-like enolase superfamily enzyme
LKITNVKASIHRVPVEVPLLKEKIVTPIVFTAVETDMGVTGYGLTRGGQRFGMKEFINREVAPFLRGKNPLETERVWSDLLKQFNARVQTGMWSSAVSTIDIALWDIKGKHYQEPVWRLLGGAQNPVQAYVTFGLKQYQKEQLVEVAKQLVKQGEKRLKMVVAVDPENPKIDAERVRAVCKAVGDDVEIMIDANYLFSYNRALELCKMVEPLNIITHSYRSTLMDISQTSLAKSVYQPNQMPQRKSGSRRWRTMKVGVLSASNAGREAESSRGGV